MTSDPSTLGHSLDDYLERIGRKLDAGELGSKAPAQDPIAEKWPREFRRVCRELGIQRYARELARIDAGDLEENDLLREFRARWRGRDHQWDSAILIGHTGIGKSVAALDACRETFKAGRRFDFADFGQLSMAWRTYDEARIAKWKATALLVVDEVAMAATATPGAFQLFSLLVNLRYRNDLPTILATVDNFADVQQAIGPELVDRFPLIIASKEARSYRQHKPWRPI